MIKTNFLIKILLAAIFLTFADGLAKTQISDSSKTYNFIVAKKIVTKKQNKKNLTLNIKYPVFEIDKIDKKISAHIKKAIKYVKPDKKDHNPDYGNNELEIRYKIKRFGNKIISIVFDEYAFCNGAAHGNSTKVIFNFRTDNFENIKYSSFLKKGYLKQLSRIVKRKTRKELEKIDVFIDEGWLESGTEPKLENFNKFYIFKNNLCIYLEPYQVTCYACASQGIVITIPFKEIKKVLIRRKGII